MRKQWKLWNHRTFRKSIVYQRNVRVLDHLSDDLRHERHLALRLLDILKLNAILLFVEVHIKLQDVVIDKIYNFDLVDIVV